MSIEDTVKRAAMLNERIGEMTRELDGLKAELREEIGTGKSAQVGDVTVKIEQNKRWDLNLAKQVIPLTLQTQVSTQVIDRALASRVLTAEMYEACQKESTPRVIFS